MPNTHIPISSNDIPSEVGYTPGVGTTAIQAGVQSTDASGNVSAPEMVENIEPSGYVSAVTPPSATNASSDTPYTFSTQVNRVTLQNNTSSNVYYAFDTVASAGSLLLAPGVLITYPKRCTVLHLYTIAAQNINGNTAGNIVVLGAF